MIEEDARVIAVDEPGFAWVDTQRRRACGGCSASGTCGTGALARFFGDRRTQVRVLDPVGVRPGEQVVVGIEESTLVQGSLAVYLLPLLTLLGGALLAGALWPQAGEGPVVTGGFLGLGAGLGGLALFTRRIARDPRYQPVVLRRLEIPLKGPEGILAP